MRGYSIYRKDMCGFEEQRQYSLDYSAALQRFNDKLRVSISEAGSIMKKDFSNIKREFKKENFHKKSDHITPSIEIICSRSPFILYKENKDLKALVYWFDEIELLYEEIILQEIEFTS